MKNRTKKCKGGEKRAEKFESTKNSADRKNCGSRASISQISIHSSSSNFWRQRDWIKLLPANFSSTEIVDSSTQAAEILCSGRLMLSYLPCINYCKRIDEDVLSADLEAEVLEAERSTFLTDYFSEGGAARGEDLEVSVMRSPQPSVSSRKMPSTAEIDEFFVQAEKREARRFAEKYNYDVENDLPLEGPYQWIPLKD